MSLAVFNYDLCPKTFFKFILTEETLYFNIAKQHISPSVQINGENVLEKISEVLAEVKTETQEYEKLIHVDSKNQNGHCRKVLKKRKQKDKLGAGIYSRRTLRRVAKRSERLGNFSREVLGHTVATLGM